ncbi:MAG: DUF2442 domain-containing protein [Deltaproteobacteria bacterium]|nr:DUF2442 domain-containing protein [Deltaproteobacteria bacterium]
MKIPKIKDAKVIDINTILVTFTNGEIKKYDIKRLSDNEIFAPLKNYAYFKNIKIENGGYAVFWDSNIDISEYELWQNGETA